MSNPCAECPYVKKGITPKIITGSGDPGGIVVCGEAPTKDDIRTLTPFNGTSGRMLWNALKQVIPNEKIYTTYAVQCYHTVEDIPGKEHVKACRERLRAEVEATKPTKVLALGTETLHSLVDGLKRTDTITKLRGRVFDTSVGKVLGTYNPGYIMHRPEAYKDFIKDVAALGPQYTPDIKDDPIVTVIHDVQDMNRLVQRVQTLPITHAVCDLETTGLDETEPQSRITCIGLCFNDTHAYVITEEALKLPFVVMKLKLLLENAKYHWVNHNVFFDYHWLKVKLGIDWKAEFDTFLASYALDERRGTHSLKALAKEFFGAGDYGREAKENEFWRNPDGVDKDKLYWYCGLDVWYTYRLRTVLENELLRENIKEVHDNILFPLARALSEIERVGILLDVEYLEQQKVDLSEKIEIILREIRKYAEDENFNPNSWQQIQKLLCDKLKVLPKGSSTSAENLELVEKAHPVIGLLLEYRKYKKVLSTYVISLLEKRNSDDRIRASFNIDGTRSGRLSSSNPNLQNIPKDMGPLIRNGFIATPGWKLCEIDLSQAELRVLAVRSGDPQLLRAFQNDSTDIHRQVASIMFHVPYDKVTPLQRKAGKTLGFAIIYGRGIASIAMDLEDTYDNAARMRRDFFDSMPKVREHIRERHEFVLKNFYSETSFGRKRRFPCIFDAKWDEFKRESFNAEIQGTAADVCNMAIVRLHNTLNPSKARIIATVHDSVLVEYKPEYEDEILTLLHKEMEKPVLGPQLKFKSDHHVGYRWGDLAD